MLHVEFIYAKPNEPYFMSLSVPENSTIEDVIRASGVLEKFSELILEKLNVGIFGKKKTLNDIVTTGDRVEIYRSLLIDPMDARRQRAPAPKRRKF